MNLDKKTTCLLKYIYKHPYVSYLDLSCFKKRGIDRSCIDETLLFLSENNFISCRSASCQKDDTGKHELPIDSLEGHFITLPSGNAYAESELLKNRKWFISTLLTIFAVIATYLGLFL